MSRLIVFVAVDENENVTWGIKDEGDISLNQIALAITYLEKAKQVLLEYENHIEPLGLSVNMLGKNGRCTVS